MCERGRAESARRGGVAASCARAVASASAFVCLLRGADEHGSARTARHRAGRARRHRDVLSLSLSLARAPPLHREDLNVAINNNNRARSLPRALSLLPLLPPAPANDAGLTRALPSVARLMAAGAVCARAGERGKRWRKEVVGARRCRPRPPPRCARLTLFSFERHPARTSSNDAMVVWWSCLGKTEMWRGHTGGRGGELLSSEAARRRWGGWRRRRSQEAASPPGLPARTTPHRSHPPLRQTHTTPLRQTRTQTK